MIWFPTVCATIVYNVFSLTGLAFSALQNELKTPNITEPFQHAIRAVLFFGIRSGRRKSRTTGHQSPVTRDKKAVNLWYIAQSDRDTP